MSDATKAPSRLPWPPVIFVASIAIAIIADLVYPLPWFTSPLSDILFAAGLLVLVAVVAIDVTAIRAMAQAKTTIMPTRPSEHLVTNGPFSFTRNPIYLANALVMIGAGFITGIAWLFIFAIAGSFLTQKLAVEPEERHLQARFGKRYLDYKKKVRRWI
jgi:protein-S-isoprenylcysteine O-methyltransferase Ste14